MYGICYDNGESKRERDKEHNERENESYIMNELIQYIRLLGVGDNCRLKHTRYEQSRKD